MNNFIQVMKALSDQNRVKIIKMLQVKSMCVCEMQALLHIAQPTVSKHLKILEEAGLVTFKKDGLWVNYQLADGQKSPYAASLLGNLKHWLSDEQNVKDIIVKMPFVSREEICGKQSDI